MLVLLDLLDTIHEDDQLTLTMKVQKIFSKTPLSYTLDIYN